MKIRLVYTVALALALGACARRNDIVINWPAPQPASASQASTTTPVPAPTTTTAPAPTTTPAQAPTPAVIINEVLADPLRRWDPDPSKRTGIDANGDGQVSSGDDEFVEIINISGADIDLGGWTIGDAAKVRHEFPAGTMLAAGKAYLVFGGPAVTGSFGGATAGEASLGSLTLTNSGDTVELKDDQGKLIDSMSYGKEGGENESLTRATDGQATAPFVKHGTAKAGTAASPGTDIHGASF